MPESYELQAYKFLVRALHDAFDNKQILAAEKFEEAAGITLSTMSTADISAARRWGEETGL